MLELREKMEGQLLSHWESLSPNDALFPLRKGAWERFRKIGFPGARHEAFQYVPLRALFAEEWEKKEAKTVAREEIAPFVLPECRGSCLVFVDGCFSRKLSDLSSLPDKMAILPLHEAMRSYGIFLQNRFARLLKEESDPFALLNAALQNEGAFVYIPPHLAIEQPIQILQIASQDSLLISPRLHMFLGKGAEASFISTVGTLEKKSWMNQGIDLILEENAKLKWQDFAPVSTESWNFTACRAHLKKNAFLDLFSFSSGAKTHRLDYKIHLCEENASAVLKGVALLQETLESHIHVLVEHQAPHTHSRQHFKNVLQDKARASFTGKIHVFSPAQKTEAYQLYNCLLLSDEAQGYAKPNLEIFADDVKASHGATFSEVREEELFYLRSRGLSVEQAKALLVAGFCQEIMEEVSLGSLQKELRQRLTAYLARRAS